MKKEETQENKNTTEWLARKKNVGFFPAKIKPDQEKKSPGKSSIEWLEEVEGVRVIKTKTTPKRQGKTPKTIWQVKGDLNGLKEHLYDLGGQRWGSGYSFFESDPSDKIVHAIKKNGRLSFEEQKSRKAQRAEKRSERYGKYSENAAQRADDHHDQAKKIEDCIPYGQPVLIGHHSESCHQNYIKKIDRNTRKAIEEKDKARHHKSRASGIEYRLDREVNDKAFIARRIHENEAFLRRLERNESGYSIARFKRLRIETIQKIAYYKANNEKLKEVETKPRYSAENVEKGDLVTAWAGTFPVLRANEKTVTIGNWQGLEHAKFKFIYEEITKVKKQDK